MLTDLQGHAYAAQAEEYAAKGQIDRAAEAHKKAAENYLRAQETTENPEVSISWNGRLMKGVTSTVIITRTTRTEVWTLFFVAKTESESASSTCATTS